MAASFLCDRETTKVAKEQPGFCNYIVIPIWNLVSTIMPQTEVAANRAQENVVNWQQHEETGEELEVYKIKRRKTSVNMLKKNQPLIIEGQSSSASPSKNNSSGTEETKQLQ